MLIQEHRPYLQPNTRTVAIADVLLRMDEEWVELQYLNSGKVF